jgi:hypothetical protein
MLAKYSFMSKIIFMQKNYPYFMILMYIYMCVCVCMCVFCFSGLVNVPHIYKYSIGPTPKSIEYHLFRQFLKFIELPR